MPRYQITNHETSETVELVRDVRHRHPEWVHEQMGTETESDLQHALDQYRDEDMRGQGPDVDGVELVEESVACAYCGWEHSEEDEQVVPSSSDDDAWERLSRQHGPECEWIATRAHRFDV